MRLVPFLPLALALACLVPIAAARYVARVDRVLARIANRCFGSHVDLFRGERPDRRAALRAAQLPTTDREYGATTLLYATIATVVGAVLGIYAGWGLLSLLAIDPETIRAAVPGPLAFLAGLAGVPSLSAIELAALLLGSAVTVGAVAGAGTYWFRWWYPSYLADGRARRIEASLPAAVAFLYALSKSGMAVPDAVRVLADQEDTYGEVAAEFSVAVREMDTFGTDVITALETMGRRSPSPQFREFTENLVGVLRSGQPLSTFLERQYRDYREEAESQQESALGLLATLAEAYVTVLVAGPLFLITILVVIGIAAGETFGQLQLLVYLFLPLANLGFVVYLSTVTEDLTPGRGSSGGEQALESPSVDAVPTERAPDLPGARPHPNVERVRYYRRLRGLRERLGQPLRTLVGRPSLTFVITVPLVLAAFVGRHSPLAGEVAVTAVDDTIAVGALFAIGVFAVAEEVRRRRLSAIEAAVPDLLDRLASANEAGSSIVAAIDRVRDSELGPLGDELDRVWADVEWGADLQTALRRFEGRVGTRSVSRVVTLLTESMAASGNLGTTLRIAARGAAADRRLERERRQAMLEYVVVVYVSFLVFLFIIGVLSGYLLPNLPTEGAEIASGTGTTELGGLSGGDAEAYATLFYHATLVQGLLSGLIAGQLSTGDVRAGAKHAAIMLALTIGLFTVVL
ncbi:type II secretion system F domain-containing protein [Natrinema pellirubrum DSM 15624]|uniref:Archaeal flagella assembly protein J n=1 Tax=Natrinema pellirubrum (strain DSM 15624 / CIP 106293 / JCM 10476 / NCIMB 786 / 157) TaxID=797303 RepID=L0JNY7_NATP1|nr:type II secretion system F family protein [Natrinema pellirubrum]AGB32563.1 archaeal flagella assembly protein J [Natrinema pellirubrum DSM 15624]ELY73699.1 type II secretion system F domain-containing protein [Natrinema pellirubrum DSM 15624]